MVNLAVRCPKNKKDSCLRENIAMITLKEKPGELHKENEKLRENFLELRWRGMG